MYLVGENLFLTLTLQFDWNWFSFCSIPDFPTDPIRQEADKPDPLNTGG